MLRREFTSACRPSARRLAAAETTARALVLGIGLAATRSIISFFRHDTGAHNVVKGKVSHVVTQGISQAGNVVWTFLHLGFKEDESGRVIWDRANAHIAARPLSINFRFARPGGAAAMHEPGSQGVLRWRDRRDRGRGYPTAGLLAGCRGSGPSRSLQRWELARLGTLTHPRRDPDRNPRSPYHVGQDIVR